MEADSIAAARRWLSSHSPLQAAQREALAAIAPALLQDVVRGRSSVVGIAGAPGTGKSTLAGMLRALLRDSGQPALVLSLDDYYLPRRDRERLAREWHPLFAQRGVPGTHDMALLLDHLDRLRSDAGHAIALPRFDKASDDRLDETRVVHAADGPVCILLEGWIVGVPPQREAALREPCNDFERERDPDGAWRRRVNEILAGYAKALTRRLDLRWLMLAPGWNAVVDWRWAQEREIPQPRRMLADHAAVADFLGPFQRLCDHMVRSGEAWADRIIDLDQRHRPRLR